MSFFIKNKSATTGKKNAKAGKFDKKKGVKRKINSQQSQSNRRPGKKPHKNPQHANEDDDDNITSSDEEISQNVNDHTDFSEDDNETAQEKKLRLAKIYLEEIEREEKEKREEHSHHTSFSEEIVEKRLREDYLKQTGKFKANVANLYKGADIDSLKTLHCKEQRNAVTCLCLSDNNLLLFSGSKCGTIIKWCMKDYKKLAVLPYVKKNKANSSPATVKGHDCAVMSLALPSDMKYLASGDISKAIHIWNPENFQHLHTFSGHRAAITGLVFRRDTHTLYSCSKDRSVKVWSLDEMLYVETMYGHQDQITCIDALNRERAITSGGRDATIRIWKIAEESQLIYNGNAGCSIDIVRLLNEENFISGGDDGQLCLWSSARKKPLCTVKEAHGVDETNGQPNWISAVGTYTNADLVASGSRDGFIRLWKLDDGFRKITPMFTIAVEGFVNCLQFTTDGRCLIAAVATEHRFGRWTVLKHVKNRVIVIPLLKES